MRRLPLVNLPVWVSEQRSRAARKRRVVAAAAATAALAMALSSCAPSAAPVPTEKHVDWPTIGFNLQRTGENPHERVLGVSNVAELKQKWLAASFRYVDTSPVLAAGVLAEGKRQDLLYFGTEEGKLYAVNATTGTIIWSRQLSYRIGVDPLCAKSPFGITDTPVIDLSTNRLYVVDGANKLYALNLATGRTVPHWPVLLPDGRNVHLHVWSGLTELNSVVYVATARVCDDPPDAGGIDAVNTVTAKVIHTFTVVPGKPRGGGVWGWGGVTVDPSHRHLYVATADAFGPNEEVPYANSVLELSPTLRLLGHAQPPLPKVGDYDIGSAPVLFTVGGCPPALAVEDKIGELFLYKQGLLGVSPPQELTIASGSRADLIGDVAYSAQTQLVYVTDPSGATSGGVRYVHGLLAFRTEHPSCRLDPTPVWQEPNLGRPTKLPNPMSPPTIANGVVYFGSGQGQTVYAVNATTGKVLWHDHLKRSNGIYAAPIVVNGWLYVPTWNGMYAFHT
jgi:outer membrane protein assembly factor BamB